MSASQNDCPGISHRIHPIGSGFEQLVVTDAVTTLTVPQGAVMAIVGVHDQAIYSRDDGTNASATVGRHHAAATEFAVCGTAMDRLTLFLDDDAQADSEVSVSYYGMEPN